MENFIKSFNTVAKEAARIAASKGWSMNSDPTSQGNKIALMHSELSEALEALRHGNPPSDHIPEFNGVEEEFADTIIRIMHMSYSLGYDVAGALIAKLEFNSGRKYKHGGKKF